MELDRIVFFLLSFPFSFLLLSNLLPSKMCCSGAGWLAGSVSLGHTFHMSLGAYIFQQTLDVRPIRRSITPSNCTHKNLLTFICTRASPHVTSITRADEYMMYVYTHAFDVCDRCARGGSDGADGVAGNSLVCILIRCRQCVTIVFETSNVECQLRISHKPINPINPNITCALNIITNSATFARCV